jgi:hypothetical protein
MSDKTIDDGGPAFPVQDMSKWQVPGMSLRIYLAAKAMQGMLANQNQDWAPLDANSQEAVVRGAYEIADAMLKAGQS